jgi:hypothetical protein
MNEELIRKLHEQAWGETYEKAITVTETPIDFQKVLKERFAELIIRECANVVKKEMDYDANWCDDKILKHFGVE